MPTLDIAVVVYMDIDEIRRRFEPAVNEIIDACCITEDFVDKDRFRVYIATIWGNAVLQPEKSGIDESDLSVLHDFLNEEIQKLLGHPVIRNLKPRRLRQGVSTH